ncbi:Extracellular cystatin-like protease inhibitor, partial [Phytophthora megakarya]
PTIMFVSRVVLVSFTLIALSAIQAMGSDWVEVNVTDADNELLYAALANTSTYSPNITTFVCANVPYSLKTQVASPSTSNYNFHVGGCILRDSEFVGSCPVNTAYNCKLANMHIFVESQLTTNASQLTSITVEKPPSYDFDDKWE